MADPTSSAALPDSKLNCYSRKQKSLGLLCLNFLQLYDRDGVESIGLDEAASTLGVERRRIYDIVNVLERFGMLVRKAKNSYYWKGFDAIPKALEELKEAAQRENFCSHFGRGSLSSNEQYQNSEDANFSTDQNVGNVKDKSQSTSFQDGNSMADASTRGKTENRREKSLGLLTQNFVKLFLCTNADMVSLDEAAMLLLGDAPNCSNMRSNSAAKVRRLYDIANVLSSMNLIQKTQTKSRKPAFKWLGYKGKHEKCTTESELSFDPKPCSKRVFGADITNSDFKRHRLISSIENEEESIKVPLKCGNQHQDAQMPRQKDNNDYDYGPCRPATLMEGPVVETAGKRSSNWDDLASNFRPQYHNQALKDLFAHYMEAWKSWYAQISQENNYQPLKEVH